MSRRARIPTRPVLAIAAALAVVAAGAAAFGITSAQAATTSLCQEQTASVAGGSYIVQNNEYDSSASECVSTDGNADFTVANSSIANATNGSPGSYPSIYQGCHWGSCSSGGLTTTPVQVSKLTPGQVTTSWSTTQPGGSSAYDVAYDIWFNKTPATSGQPNCTELMVWLNHNGSVQPFGSQVASGVSVGGHTYNIWEGGQSSWNTISYSMTTATTSVSNLDVGTLAQDAVSRGYLSSSCYLIDVEAGFELWQGGAGLATSSFSVTVAGSSSSPSPSPTPTSPSPSPSPTSSGPAVCSAAYSVTSSWSGGFQGQVVVKNTGSGTLSGWRLGWTFGGNQQISNLWNGTSAQSGQAVTVTNASYDGSLAPGGTATVGFTASYTGTNTAPSAVTCT
ncbi:MAG TPA: cellulose binding domain-containing protein [Streptosporangiaceae bacterium]|nr:cellulose binding domain-containing protein [Streptosporangiaceae bacterium]